MPKKVDHESRRKHIAESLWRVAARDGIHAVSVRSVAAEAETSPTALRYFFATQDELMEFAMRTAAQRVAERTGARSQQVRDVPNALDLLAELIPIDEDRRLEQEVYLAFILHARDHPKLRAIRDEIEAQLSALVRTTVHGLAEAGQLRADIEVTDAVDRTYAILDGLAFHGALWPARYPAERLLAALHSHLYSLAPQPQDPQPQDP
ncbi:TetR/AcrR family transcriptional regulator [Tamaricihabitans halophyticus]|nr:TetR family transcriptional regulator C-terminal domain-containing protein [Tamaricihabitans halophyticus]